MDAQTNPPAPRPLTERQREVLRLVVQEYVASTKPVASKTLVERHRVGYSPATIRNEMADLEAAGYLQALHTSGGRVPTDQGYRYFVHYLMGAVELPPSDQIMIRHQFRQVEVHLDQWMGLAAATLAEVAGNVSIVTAPRLPTAKLRHIELIALQPRLGLLILVTVEGTVRQVLCHWPEATEQEALSRLADALALDLRGLTGDEVAARVGGIDGLARFVLDQIAQALRGLDAAERTEVHHSGLERMLAQPEIAGDALGLLELLHGGGFLSAVLPSLQRGAEVKVFIGDDNPAGELRRFGLVVSTYGVDGEVTGVLGVVGPTRMAYDRSISSVRYMARLVSDLMADLYSA